MRRLARIDGNQKAIVDALRRVGATVRSAAALGEDFPDLVVAFRGATFLLEVKNPDGLDRVSKGQRAFIEDWAAPVHVVRSVEEALAAIGVRAAGAAGGAA